MSRPSDILRQTEEYVRRYEATRSLSNPLLMTPTQGYSYDRQTGFEPPQSPSSSPLPPSVITHSHKETYRFKIEMGGVNGNIGNNSSLMNRSFPVVELPSTDTSPSEQLFSSIAPRNPLRTSAFSSSNPLFSPNLAPNDNKVTTEDWSGSQMYGVSGAFGVGATSVVASVTDRVASLRKESEELKERIEARKLSIREKDADARLLSPRRARGNSFNDVDKGRSMNRLSSNSNVTPIPVVQGPKETPTTSSTSQLTSPHLSSTSPYLSPRIAAVNVTMTLGEAEALVNRNHALVSCVDQLMEVIARLRSEGQTTVKAFETMEREYQAKLEDQRLRASHLRDAVRDANTTSETAQHQLKSYEDRISGLVRANSNLKRDLEGVKLKCQRYEDEEERIRAENMAVLDAAKRAREAELKRVEELKKQLEERNKERPPTTSSENDTGTGIASADLVKGVAGVAEASFVSFKKKVFKSQMTGIQRRFKTQKERKAFSMWRDLLRSGTLKKEKETGTGPADVPTLSGGAATGMEKTSVMALIGGFEKAKTELSSTPSMSQLLDLQKRNNLLYSNLRKAEKQVDQLREEIAATNCDGLRAQLKEKETEVEELVKQVAMWKRNCEKLKKYALDLNISAPEESQGGCFGGKKPPKKKDPPPFPALEN